MTEQQCEPRGAALVVDLDGTLVRSDLLHEAVIALVARSPIILLRIVWWCLLGKARLKQEIFSRVAICPELLPFDERVVALLRSTEQRPRVLCTASGNEPAMHVASHLGIFDEVLTTCGDINLAGVRKAEALVARFGERGFDYVANARVDLHVWRHARRAWVVNAGNSLARAASVACEVVAHWPKVTSSSRTWIKALRLHQWLKNLLVFVPLLASHRFLEPASLASAIMVFIAFSLCASSVYLVNDLLDLDSDRRHPRKRLRPLAAGALPVADAVLAAPLLAGVGLAVAALVNAQTLGALTVYLVMTAAYSLRLKRIVLVDVVTLAGLYTIRIVAGGLAIYAPLSFWLLAFSIFLFLSLAMLKRFTELRLVQTQGKSMAAGRGYRVVDITTVQTLGGASGLIAVLVLCLYINSQASVALYRTPEALWLLCPLLLYWVSRVWLLANRGEMHDDPIVFAVKDGPSQFIAVIAAMAAYFAL